MTCGSKCWPALLAAACCFTACGGPDHIEINPDQVLLKRKNEGIWVQCVGKNRAGHTLPKLECGWRISNEKIASVDQNGKLVGHASGQTTLYATHGKLEAEAPVRIEAVERIEVVPNSLTFNVGDPQKSVTVKAFTYADHPLDTAKDRKPEYKTQNPDIAAVADVDQIFPGQPGQTTVTIYVDDMKYELPVTVLPKGKAAASKGGASKKGGKKGKK